MQLDNTNMLTDKWGRTIDYLRIAVTDRCNLRCFYCMPAEGIQYLKKDELLSYEEIIRLTTVFASLGVRKVRITGGEPFVRKDIIQLIKNISKINGIESVNITTNGVLTLPYLDQLVTLGIDQVNLSLDSLNKENFYKITRRNEFDTVIKTLDGLFDRGIKTKINMVVMGNKNTHEILDMASLTQQKKVSVRFIEEMPFNGSDAETKDNWSHVDILDELKNYYPNLTRTYPFNTSDPATVYNIPNHVGNIGIIAAHSRTFCGTCNRIRLTALGEIKNCLYDEGVLDIKSILRSGVNDDYIRDIIKNTVQKKEENGIVAEENRLKNKRIIESMSTIGG